MATTTSPLTGENEEDPAPMNDLKYSHDDDHHDTPTQDASTTDSKTLPAQKRRRVGRACDECRRKKIKCDGKQPCTHCTVYSYGTQSPMRLNLGKKVHMP